MVKEWGVMVKEDLIITWFRWDYIPFLSSCSRQRRVAARAFCYFSFSFLFHFRGTACYFYFKSTIFPQDENSSTHRNLTNTVKEKEGIVEPFNLNVTIQITSSNKPHEVFLKPHEVCCAEDTSVNVLAKYWNVWCYHASYL